MPFVLVITFTKFTLEQCDQIRLFSMFFAKNYKKVVQVFDDFWLYFENNIFNYLSTLMANIWNKLGNFISPSGHTGCHHNRMSTRQVVKVTKSRRASAKARGSNPKISISEL